MPNQFSCGLHVEYFKCVVEFVISTTKWKYKVSMKNFTVLSQTTKQMITNVYQDNHYGGTPKYCLILLCVVRINGYLQIIFRNIGYILIKNYIWFKIQCTHSSCVFTFVWYNLTMTAMATFIAPVICKHFSNKMIMLIVIVFKQKKPEILKVC